MAEESTATQAQEQQPTAEAHADATDWKAEARKWEDRAKANRDAQKAAEEALAAKSDYDELKAKLQAAEAERDKLMADKERADAIAHAAKEHGVDAELLARMSGDVDENAAYLAAMPRYKAVHDGGEGKAQAVTRESIEAIKDPLERVKARAEHQYLYK